MQKKWRVGVLLLLVAGITLGLILNRPAKPYERHSRSFFGSFDTVISILGFAQSQEEFDLACNQAEASFQRYHRYYDKYNPYDGIVNAYTLNQEAAKAPIKVEPELYGLLRYAKDMHRQTKGQVNIALGAVLALWHDAREAAVLNPEQAALPSMDALKEAAKHCNIDDLVLDDAQRSVYFADPLLQIDLGAVAKGYAAEKVAQDLLKGRVRSFVINAGGNVRAGSGPLDGRKNWGIAVQDPDGFAFSDANSDILDVLFLHNTSVVTSGDYQRYFMYEGQRYHHLISPDTLMPPHHFRSVSIVTEDSAYADLLSTAVFLMPYEEGRAFVDSLDGVEALWVLNDRSIVMTDALTSSARSQGATNPQP